MSTEEGLLTRVDLPRLAVWKARLRKVGAKSRPFRNRGFPTVWVGGFFGIGGNAEHKCEGGLGAVGVRAGRLGAES